jgi:ATP-binding cassette, subfamily B, multidrug efflux pump
MIHIRKLFHFVKPYWKPAVLSLILLTSLVFLDLSIPRLIQRIIDQGINQHNQDVVLQTAAIMIVLSLLSTLIAIGNNIFSIRAGEGVARDLREALFLKIQTYSFGDLDRQRTGQLLVRLTSDVNALKTLTQISLRIGTRAPMLMIGSLILMISTSATLALTLIPLLVGTSALIVFFILKMEPLFRTVQQKLDRLNTVLQENIAGARLVKSFVRADFEGERFEGANEDLTARSIKVMQFMSSMGPILTVCVNIGMAIVLWSGGLQAIRGDMTIGQIVAFTNYLLTTMTPLIMMTMLSNTWAAGIVSARRVNEILDTVPEVQDRPGAVALPEHTRGRVVFDHVTFRYNANGHAQPAEGADEEKVLDDVNLVAEPGETVAILGATGAGKSSLVNLVPRFYDVTGGHILFDGIDVRNIQQEQLIAQVGSVSQETILFSGTVRDNIRYGCPGASDDEVVAAAKAAQAHDFILRFPNQYDTHVEERGANLSGGQKQRVAIARAILTHPRILILDDATSSVDVETETQIQDALDELMQHTTSFVVAQRISTVLKADKIVVIDQGRVVAQGTHRELMQSSPIYREIYDSQLGGGVRLQGDLESPDATQATAARIAAHAEEVAR